MSSKKSAQDKRTNPPRNSSNTRQFQKDWERLRRSGRYDLHRLKRVMLLIVANEGPLPPEYLDHGLTGEWHGFRECHVGGDFLLIYLLREDGAVVFVRAGTHAELFE